MQENILPCKGWAPLSSFFESPWSRVQSATIGHVGDSRAYVYRQNHLIPLTRDHSLVELYVEQGRISSEEAITHPQRHILTQAIGLDKSIQPTVATHPLHTDDLILLCSDGLTSMLSDPEIGEILQHNGKNIENACKALIHHALQQGGEDNITVILCASQ